MCSIMLAPVDLSTSRNVTYRCVDIYINSCLVHTLIGAGSKKLYIPYCPEQAPMGACSGQFGTGGT